MRPSDQSDTSKFEVPLKIKTVDEEETDCTAKLEFVSFQYGLGRTSMCLDSCNGIYKLRSDQVQASTLHRLLHDSIKLPPNAIHNALPARLMPHLMIQKRRILPQDEW